MLLEHAVANPAKGISKKQVNTHFDDRFAAV
jgi:hypothetical protein